MSPVSGSVCACTSDLVKARSMPMRSPALREISSTLTTVLAGGGFPSSATEWSTPTVFPAMLTGTHTAEHAPSGAVLEIRAAIEIAAAGPHLRLPAVRGRAVPGRHHRAPASAELGRRRDLAEVRLARVGEEQLGGEAGSADRQRPVQQGVGGLFGVHHLQRALQPRLELVARRAVRQCAIEYLDLSLTPASDALRRARRRSTGPRARRRRGARSSAGWRSDPDWSRVSHAPPVPGRAT